MGSIRWLLASSIFLVAACVTDLEGAPCPCAAGFECCVARNVCYAHGQSCAADSAGGTGPAGSGGSSGANAAAGSDAGGTDSRTHAGSAGSMDEAGGSPSEAIGAAGALEPVNEPAFTLVATQHNDNARTGANLSESVLAVSTVKQASFGQLSRRALRGAVYAQPLVAPAVKLPTEETHDLVYVATMANTVYALDARSPGQAPLWTQTLGPSIVLPDPTISDLHGEIWHEVGILGTPVLSVADGALYVVAATKEEDRYAHHLHKLELSTGKVLASTAIADADFANARYAQRGALTLAHGVLYVPFGGYDPFSDVSGWIFAFDTNLAPLGSVRLGDIGSGVTMSGQGPAADDVGSLFLAASSGFLGPTKDQSTYGSRVIALQGATGDQLTELLACTSKADCALTEFGSSGPVSIPNSNELVVAGQHYLYLLNRGTPGTDGPSPSLVQKFRANGSVTCDSSLITCDATPSSPVFWPGSGLMPKPRLFAWASNDLLQAFEFDATAQRFDCGAPRSNNACAIASSAPGDSDDVENHTLGRAAHLSVSSNGSESGSGIVWAAHAYTTDSLRNPDGILRAFDAEDLSLIWNTDLAGTPLGPLAPGATPTVSGGRVFVGTADGISSKTTFWDERITDAPAVTNFADKSLVLAWGTTRSGQPGLDLFSATDGIHFGRVGRVNDTLFATEPAVASDGTHLYLAWTASDAQSGTNPVKVGMFTDPPFIQADFMTSRIGGAPPEPLSYSATSAPALIYGNHRLFLAFHDHERIVVLSSQAGSAFDSSTTIPTASHSSVHAPALAYRGGKLYLVSTDDLEHVNVFVSVDDGAHFSGPTSLPVSSAGHPALLALDPEGAIEPDLQLLWSDTNPSDSWRIKIASIVDGDFSRLSRTHEFRADLALFSMSAAWFKDAWYLTWMGVGDTNHPNVARYSPGELVTYGIQAMH